jgi:hypothetical protein
MKILIFTLFTCLFVSCSQQAVISNEKQINTQGTLTNRVENTKSEKLLEKLPSPSNKKVELPEITDFAVVDVLRKSNKENEYSRMIKPFYEAEIGIGLDKEPKIGEKVTVIPLQVNLEPFQLSITKTEKKEVPCTGERKEFYWNTDLEIVTNKEILEIDPIKNRAEEFPFDVAVIYPKVDFAKNIKNSELSKDMLPNKVAVNTVVAAIDLDNDGKPDLLETVFCCNNPSDTFNEKNDCYTCQKTFKKINNNWKETNFEKPC